VQTAGRESAPRLPHTRALGGVWGSEEGGPGSAVLGSATGKPFGRVTAGVPGWSTFPHAVPRQRVNGRARASPRDVLVLQGQSGMGDARQPVSLQSAAVVVPFPTSKHRYSGRGGGGGAQVRPSDAPARHQRDTQTAPAHFHLAAAPCSGGVRYSRYPILSVRQKTRSVRINLTRRNPSIPGPGPVTTWCWHTARLSHPHTTGQRLRQSLEKRSRELSSMKRTEAHSGVQPRRSVAHTRRLATFLANRKFFLRPPRTGTPWLGRSYGQ